MNGQQSSTVPLVDRQELYQALCDACSQDGALLRASSKSLKTMCEDRFGTYDALQDIASQNEVPLAVRQQALIQFKNHAFIHWRSRKVSSDETRERIKARCVAFLDVEDDLLADTNSIIVAKIARSEINNNWPPILSAELIRTISSAAASWANAPENTRAPPRLRRSLQLLNAMIKEIIGVKMMNGVKMMAQLISDLAQPLFEYYSVLAGQMSSLGPQAMSSARTSDTIMLAHIVFKVQSKMAVWLFPKTQKPLSELQTLDPWLRTFCQAVAAQLPTLCDLRINLARLLPSNVVAIRSMDLMTRHIHAYGKLFRRLQTVDKHRFATLPGCTPLVLFYWDKVIEASKVSSDFIDDKPTAVYPVRFLTQAMTIFRDNLSTWAPYRRNGTPNEVVLPQNLVEDAVKVLVTQFIPLQQSDLEGWKEDPESWVNTEEVENDQWEYDLRPCAERVLIVLSNQYTQFVTPLLSDTFSTIAMARANDLPSLMQKEALYCAVGRCVSQLQRHIQFDHWLETVLLPESQETDPNYPILKRRIAWVISQWISQDAASPQNPKIWQVLVHLLEDKGSGSDPVVQLTAAIAISKCVDTIGFDLNVFLPYLPTTITELVKISGDVDGLVMKQRIIKTLNVIIEQSGVHIAPFISLIAGPVPRLWTDAAEDADGQWGFKGSLLEVVSHLIKAVQEQSAPLQSLVVPLVRESLSPGKPIQNLDEDALDLWMSALMCATPTTNALPPLFELLPVAVSLLHDNLDLLGKITSIFESYYLLGASAVLQHSALDLFRAYKNSVSQAFPTNVKCLLNSLELVVQLAPSVLWGEAMHVSGLFPFLLQNLIDEKAESLVLSEHVHLFARIAATDSKIFVQLMDAAIASQPATVANSQDATWEALMDQWWNRFDSMSEPRHRKLTAMAMADLIATGQPVVLKRLPTEIFNLWLDVFGEMREAKNLSEERPDSPLLRYWEQARAPDYIFGESEDTLEYARREAVWNADPVRTTQLTAFVAARLQATERALGGPQALQAIIASADPTVLQQIQRELASA